MKEKIFLLLFAISFSCFSQDTTKLKEKIFKLNNAFQYKKSQKILLDIIKNSSSDADKFDACVLLSDTYKRVFDYVSTEKYLNKALQYKTLPQQKNKINSLKAMVFFDTHKYQKSKEIMLELEKISFDGLHKEEISIILMQIGYIYYLEKNHTKAQEYYEKSLNIMNTAPVSCNQPIVYGKMLVLFKDMQKLEAIEPLLKKGLLRAEQCNIIKYKLYLLEEYKRTIDTNNYKKKSLIYKQIDSIKNLYNAPKKTSELLNSEKEIVANDLKQEKKTNKYYIVASGLLLVIAFFSFLFFFKNKKQKKLLEKENTKIKQELTLILEKTTGNTKKIAKLLSENKLTDRQKEVLDLTSEGLSNKEISNKLHISENTVKYHIKNIYKILQKNGVQITRR